MAPSARPDEPDTHAWRAGVARRTITPTERMWMAGFGFREGPATGTDQELAATALALEDRAGNRAVLLSVELLFVTDEIRHRLVTERLADVKLAADELFVTATHTHCGPEYRDLKLDMYADEPEQYREAAARYRDRLVAALGDAVEDALAALAPARLAYDHARCGFAMNRRRPTKDGIAHVPNPDGPVDHDVPVLTVRRDDTVQAIAFGYACHTTAVMRCDGWMRFNGDWAGVARDRIEADYPEATALFLQGCAGDQNPYPRGTRELAEHHGRTMANAVGVAVEASRTTVHGPLRTHLADQPIELRDPPAPARLRELASGEDRIDRVRARELLAELDDTGTIDTTRSVPVHGIGFGDDLVLAGLGGEVLVEYARRLKRAADGPCWVAGYTNTGFTYVPTAAALAAGGYEGETAFRYAGLPGPPRPDTEERVVRQATAVIDGVGSPQ